MSNLNEYFTNPTTFQEGYFKFSKIKIILILGIAISALATFITIYNYVSGINNLENCAISVEIQKQKQIKFIWILVLSLIAFVIGLLLSWMFRHKPHRIFSFSILFIGIFGILYAIAYKLNTLPGIDKTLIFISVLAFITFVMLGIVFDVVTKQRGGKEPATIGEFFSNDYNYKPASV